MRSTTLFITLSALASNGDALRGTERQQAVEEPRLSESADDAPSCLKGVESEQISFQAAEIEMPTVGDRRTPKPVHGSLRQVRPF